MQVSSIAVITALSTLTLAGCDLWYGNRHCDSADEPALAIGLLDPFTGQCQFSGGGGGSTCGDFGGPVADQAPEFVDMASCFSECTGLAESECLTAFGCRAAYVSDCPEGFDCDNTTYTYFECWATAPSGPVQGDCSALDAYECSRHDDCVANHFPGADCAGGNCAPTPDTDSIGNFEYCSPEPVTVDGGCYGDEDCAPDLTCNASEVCLPPPGCTDPAEPCPAVCYGMCV